MTTEDSGIPAATAADNPNATIDHPSVAANIHWPGWLEEFYQAYQEERIAGHRFDIPRDELEVRPDAESLEKDANETLAQLHATVAAIEGTPANNQEALAVKLAVSWNYHADELPFSADVTDDLPGELLLLRTSLDALARQTGLSLFGLWDRNGHSVLPDCDNPDAGLIWLEQEFLRLVHYADNAPGGLSDEDQDSSTDRQQEIQQAVARTHAATPAGVAVKMRLLRGGFDDLKTVWGEEGWETCLTSLEKINGSTGEPEAEPGPKRDVSNVGHNDGADESIIRLWQERGRLTAEADRILTLAADDEDSDAQARADVLDSKATEIEKRIAIMTANGPAGWAIQVALLALWMERGPRSDKLDQRLVARLGAYFLGTVSPLPDVATGDNPDTELRSLWQEYRQNSKTWGAADDDTEAEATCAKRSVEIERRIIATPSESAVGLAIKLRIAVDNTPEDEEPEFNDQRAMLAVLDDVDRLAGFKEPRRVWRAS